MKRTTSIRSVILSVDLSDIFFERKLIYIFLFIYLYVNECNLPVMEDDTCSEDQQKDSTAAHDTKLEESPIIQQAATPVQEETSQGGLSKKEKAQRKKDKKLQKERDQLEEKERLKESLAALPSQRDEELDLLTQQLRAEGLAVKHVAADGHCLYR